MSKFKRRAATAATFVTVLALTACGGGSSSSSGSGNSGGGSSTLVVNSSPSMAMLLRPHWQTEGITHIAATISKLLMRNAWAVPLAGSDVIVFNEFGDQITPTSGDTDMLYYVVPPDRIGYVYTQYLLILPHRLIANVMSPNWLGRTKWWW